MFKDKMVICGIILFIAGLVMEVLRHISIPIEKRTLFGPPIIIIGIGILVLIIGIIKFIIIAKFNDTYKKCQFCAKTIKKEAIVCPFCSRELTKN